jgi:putative ABC transport system permease protein
VFAAVAISVWRLPDPKIGEQAAWGVAAFVVALAVAGHVVALIARFIRPRGFIAAAAMRALADPHSAAAKAVAIGIGIAAITAVDTVGAALEARLEQDLPWRLPSLILVDIQPDQRDRLEPFIDQTAGLRSVELQPNLRGSIVAANGRPADQALIDRSERWVIEGDHGISWTREPLDGGLWYGGSWWAPDYAGPMLLSISDDVAEGFGIGPGAELTFAVLGRELTGEIANVRDVRYQSVGSNFIIVASPEPLRTAPHTWHARIEGDDPAIDSLIAFVTEEFPNVTAIDVRMLLDQLEQLVGGATDAALAVATALLFTGGIALAAVIAADADAKAREGLAYALVGASRLRIALSRLAEVAVVGVVAAGLGGAAGLYGGTWLADRALRIDGLITTQSVLLPVILGVVAACAAGLAAGILAMPRGRGSLIARLAS